MDYQLSASERWENHTLHVIKWETAEWEKWYGGSKNAVTSQASSAWSQVHSCVLNRLWTQTENRKAPRIGFSWKTLLTEVLSPSCGDDQAPVFNEVCTLIAPGTRAAGRSGRKRPSLCEQPSFWHHLGHVVVVVLPSMLLNCSHLSTSGHRPVFSETWTPVSPLLYVLLPPWVTSRPLWLTHPQPVQFLPKHHLDLPHMKNIGLSYSLWLF